MQRAFTINRVGHVGIYVADMDRSIEWYSDVLGLTLTGRWTVPDGEMAFMRFTEDHHNIVFAPTPIPLGRKTKRVSTPCNTSPWRWRVGMNG
ncbi:MAG: VOC family protein [Rhodospirillaceae bacterium]|nr:VOC family protein [Rhodospirillaceae bacterium]